MKKAKSSDPDMRDEYDFSGGIRGKHYRQFLEGTNLVVLDPDVYKIFHDSESVNEALRAMGKIIEQHNRKPSRSRRDAART